MSGEVVPGKHAEGKPNRAEAENEDESLRKDKYYIYTALTHSLLGYPRNMTCFLSLFFIFLIHIPNVIFFIGL